MNTLRQRLSQCDAKPVLLLLVLAIAPYCNTLLNGFVFDDNKVLFSNPHVHRLGHIPQAFVTTLWSFEAAQPDLQYYRPAMVLSFQLGWFCFGAVPFGYHAVNLLLHASVVLVLWRVMRDTGSDSRASFLAAAVFALHPVHTESVAWIVGVCDLQLAVFCLITFSLYLRLQAPRKKALPLYGLLSLSFVAALLSKEQAVMLPALLTIYEHCCRPDRQTTGWREKALRYGPLWALALLFMLVRLMVVGALAPQATRAGVSRWQAVLTGLILVRDYIGKLFWPARLSFFYEIEAPAGIFDLRVLSGALVVAGCGFLFVWLWRRRRTAFFWLLWCVVTLAPALNVRWLITNQFAERHLYLPSVGFCALAGMAIAKVLSKAESISLRRRRALTFALVAVGLMAAGRIVTRNQDWRSAETLVTKAYSAMPGNRAVRISYADVLAGKGNLDAAKKIYSEALAANPNAPALLTGLGNLLAREKRFADSISCFRRALAASPRYIAAHLGLATASLGGGDEDQALASFQTVVQLAPLNVSARNRFASLLLRKGRLNDAEREFTRSLALDDTVEAYDGLAGICFRRRELERAKWAWERALALDRFDPNANFGLGALHMTQGSKTEALHFYQAGLMIDPTNDQAQKAVKELTVPVEAR